MIPWGGKGQVVELGGGEGYLWIPVRVKRKKGAP